MAKLIIEMDFGNVPKIGLQMMKPVIGKIIKDQFKKSGMDAKNVNVRIED